MSELKLKNLFLKKENSDENVLSRVKDFLLKAADPTQGCSKTSPDSSVQDTKGDESIATIVDLNDLDSDDDDEDNLADGGNETSTDSDCCVEDDEEVVGDNQVNQRIKRKRKLNEDKQTVEIEIHLVPDEEDKNNDVESKTKKQKSLIVEVNKETKKGHE